MLLLTLNINMFNYDIDNSFYKYCDSISPNITFVQECRYNRIKKRDQVKWPGNYEEPINSTYHLSAAISNDNDFSKVNNENSLKYDYTCIFVKYKGNIFAGVHLPLIDENGTNKGDREEILTRIKESDAQIICGDFNACSNNENQEYLECLLRDTYVDLWYEGLNNGKAYYIDFSGEKNKADPIKHANIRTFVGNTHIDYILSKKEFLTLKEIIIDFRTLAFTDHCSIILEFDINQR